MMVGWIPFWKGWYRNLREPVIMTTDVRPPRASSSWALAPLGGRGNTCICFRMVAPSFVMNGHMAFSISNHFIHSIWPKACSNSISHRDVAEADLGCWQPWWTSHSTEPLLRYGKLGWVYTGSERTDGHEFWLAAEWQCALVTTEGDHNTLPWNMPCWHIDYVGLKATEKWYVQNRFSRQKIHKEMVSLITH